MSTSGIGRATALAIGLAIVMILTAAPAGARPFAAPIDTYRLPNGIRVVLAPDPDLPNVSVAIRYGVGSADDPAGKEGLAHLVEHLMFAGSRHVPSGDYFRWIARVGGTAPSGTTSLDATLYLTTVPATALPVVFWLESDRMGFLPDVLTQSTLDREVRIIADELRGRVVDQEVGIAISMKEQALFPVWHPYHRDAHEWGLPNCTVEDLLAFWTTWYGPPNAVIAVAGNFHSDTVRDLIVRYFDDLPAREPPIRPVLPPHWGVNTMRVDVGANVPRDQLALFWKAPALDAPGDAPLDLAAAVLADPAGRLQHALVSSGLATQVSAREASEKRASVFSIAAGIADGANMQHVSDIFDSAVSAVAAGVTEEECARARHEYYGLLLSRLATSRGRAALLASRPEGNVTWGLDKYDAIDGAQVAAAVRSFLTADQKLVLAVHHGAQYPVRGTVLSRQGGGAP
ncbi:MAG TPA: pitrilysin family protein [Polyangiaceae bacterium]|jgi:zinc protease|nr:pitrilysin family protein [Polyangiaceae bacterium]